MKVSSITTMVFLVVSACSLNAAVTSKNYSREDEDGDISFEELNPKK